MTKLNQIQASELSTSEYAFFCLLYVQSQIKCNIEVSNDSLIEIAYTAYAHSDSDDLKKRAHFYNAQISYNTGDYRIAMRDALVAYDIAKEAHDNYWIAKSAELMSDIFYATRNDSQSEIYSLEAVQNYKLAGKIANHRYALCDLAIVFLNQHKDREAFRILDSLQQTVNHEEPFDSALNDYILTAKCQVYEWTKQFDQLNNSIPSKPDISAPTVEKIDYSISKSYALFAEEDFEGATSLLSSAFGITDSDSQLIQLLFVRYEQSLMSGDYKTAALTADSLLLMQSKITEDILKESIMGEQRDFYADKAKKQKRKAKSMKYALITVIIASLTLCSMLIWMYRLKMRAKHAELETNLSSFLNLKSQYEHIGMENDRLSVELNEKSSTVDSLRMKIENHSQTMKQNSLIIEHLFREKWLTLNLLCNDYFELGGSNTTRTLILNNIEKELNKARSPKNLKDIELAVDNYMGNIMSMLREECKFLKDDDFTFLSLIFAGLSVRAICLFMNIKYKLFYLKRSRLSKRILASDAPHKDLFLEKMA